MRNALRPHLLWATLCLIIPPAASAQLADYLYGLHNPGSGVFRFARMELATGEVTELEQLPITGVGSAASSCVDVAAGRYLFNTGQQLFTLDPLNQAPMVSVSYPLPSSTRFYGMAHNPCDDALYGVLNAGVGYNVFARYDRASNTFTELVDLGDDFGYSLGGMSYIDPQEQLYGLEHGGRILGIDIIGSELIYDTPIVNLSGEVFGHIAFDCALGRVIGTSYGQTPKSGAAKWVSMVDPLTGIVTHLASMYTQDALMKPALTGSCIDQNGGVFYWGGMDAQWVGASTSNGEITYSATATSPQTLYAVEHFSECACTTTGVEEASEPSSLAYPNPATRAITLLGAPPGSDLSWSDACGRIVRVPMRRTADRVDCDVAALAPGGYVVRATAGQWWRVQVMDER